MNDHQPSRPEAPWMSRSRGQLATAYAPGAFFTFEGGQGACVALSDVGAEHDLARVPESAKSQIILRLNEIVRNWYDRAMNCRPGATHQPHPRMCLDDALLRDGKVDPLDRARIEFVNPIRMGYAPAPLTFVCNTCGLFRGFDSVKQMQGRFEDFLPANCQNPRQKGECQWRQLDVIFVHWSGRWEPATPGMYEWDDRLNVLVSPRRYCGQCGSRDFVLNSSSPSIGKWFFQCALCGHRSRDTWLQNDPLTTDILRSEAGQRNTERRMEPISYRASAVFYPQSEQFIVFEEGDQELLALLDPTRVGDLENFIAKEFGYGATRPPLESMKELLEQSGHHQDWQRYEEKQRLRDQFRVLAGQMTGQNRDLLLQQIQVTERDLTELIDSWFPSKLQESNQLPPSIRDHIRNRAAFSSKYDPFTLAVEHAALRKNKLDAASDTTSGRRAYVRFTHLDSHLGASDDAERRRLELDTRRCLDQLGVEDMGLIREFDLCRFTFGFTRVQAIPFFEKRNQLVPVRLNLFPSLKNNRKPIYAITQANEALYVRLSATAVHQWLRSVGLRDTFEWSPSDRERLGARLLERAVPFGRFLANLGKDGPALAYLYVYTLLHTYAHVLMKATAEYSGLDLSSLGEYVFPADLAFVVYRNGTTMDLGNMSSLWRNNNVRFLSHLLDQKTLLCNSGSICDQLSTGACPDCVMVPETSCIAANQLLSRAVLRGGEPPREDGDHRRQPIPGFLGTANRGVSASA